jgi:hypothetical protein
MRRALVLLQINQYVSTFSPFCAKFHGLVFAGMRHIRPVEKKEGEDHETQISSGTDGGGADDII